MTGRDSRISNPLQFRLGYLASDSDQLRFAGAVSITFRCLHVLDGEAVPYGDTGRAKRRL